MRCQGEHNTSFFFTVQEIECRAFPGARGEMRSPAPRSSAYHRLSLLFESRQQRRNTTNHSVAVRSHPWIVGFWQPYAIVACGRILVAASLTPPWNLATRHQKHVAK